MEIEKPVVLFLCTGNSARSQMAEALLRHHAGDRVEAHSAGLQPKDVHPMTRQVLEEISLDASGLRSKPARDYMGRKRVTYAIIVCERAQTSCPRISPFSTHTLYWPFEDPAAFEGTEWERLQKFREIRDQIDQRIHQWVESL